MKNIAAVIIFFYNNTINTRFKNLNLKVYSFVWIKLKMATAVNKAVMYKNNKGAYAPLLFANFFSYYKASICFLSSAAFAVFSAAWALSTLPR